MSEIFVSFHDSTRDNPRLNSTSIYDQIEKSQEKSEKAFYFRSIFCMVIKWVTSNITLNCQELYLNLTFPALSIKFAE